MTDLCHTFEVELFGVARRRAGTERLYVRMPEPRCSLARLLGALAECCPELAGECFDESGLRAGYVANIAGRRFVSDPSTVLEATEPLLLLSSDAGG